jgi:hypothetical protein
LRLHLPFQAPKKCQLNLVTVPAGVAITHRAAKVMFLPARLYGVNRHFRGNQFRAKAGLALEFGEKSSNQRQLHIASVRTLIQDEGSVAGDYLRSRSAPYFSIV